MDILWVKALFQKQRYFTLFANFFPEWMLLWQHFSFNLFVFLPCTYLGKQKWFFTDIAHMPASYFLQVIYFHSAQSASYNFLFSIPAIYTNWESFQFVSWYFYSSFTSFPLFFFTGYTTGKCLATRHSVTTTSWASHSYLDCIYIGRDLDSEIWMRTSFLQMDAQEVSVTSVSDCVQACTTLWKGIKIKEVFLLPRGLSHTNSQPANFHKFLLKPLMVIMLCTAANKNEDLLITLFMFHCDYSLAYLCIEAKSSFILHSL